MDTILILSFYDKVLKPAAFLSTSPRGGRPSPTSTSICSPAFLSTSPAWGTTLVTMDGCGYVKNFYPRPPRGGRLLLVQWAADRWVFLSTSPAWGTTLAVSKFMLAGSISIHVPRVGDDRLRHQPGGAAVENFYPRPPRGGRPIARITTQPDRNFYPRPPRGGRRVYRVQRVLVICISIHVPRVGDDGHRRLD